MNDWENGFAVVTGMVDDGRGLLTREPAYEMIQDGLTIDQAERLAALLGGQVLAPGAAD